MKFTKSSLLVLVMSLAALTHQAHALTVFDPKNFVKNTITSARLIIAETQRATQIAAQYQQLATMHQNLIPIDGAVHLLRQQEALKTLGEINQYISLGSQLYGSINSARGLMEGRMREASRAGLSWDEYSRVQQQAAFERGDSLGFLRQEEVQTMDAVQRQYSQIQEMGARIPALQGNLDNQQMMNSQMNMLLGQMADLRAFSAQGRTMQTDAEMRRLADENRLKSLQDIDRQNAEKARQSSLRAVEGMKNLKTPGY